MVHTKHAKRPKALATPTSMRTASSDERLTPYLSVKALGSFFGAVSALLNETISSRSVCSASSASTSIVSEPAPSVCRSVHAPIACSIYVVGEVRDEGLADQ